MADGTLEGKNQTPSATGSAGPISRAKYCTPQCYERGKRKRSRTCRCKGCGGDAHGRGRKYACDHGYINGSPVVFRRPPSEQRPLFPPESPASAARPDTDAEEKKPEKMVLEAARNAIAP
jgi:hypothetical protein